MAGPLLKDEYCPSYEELTVPEIPLTSVMFRAGGLYFGKYCDEICKVFWVGGVWLLWSQVTIVGVIQCYVCDKENKIDP